MKGLSYRVLNMSKKQIILSFLSFAALEFFIILAYMSLKFGNLAKLSSESRSSVEGFLKTFTLIVPIISTAVVADALTSVLQKDIKSKWKSYAYVLPVKSSLYCGSYYVCYAGVIALSIVISIAVSMLNCSLSGREFTLKIFWTIMCGALIVSLYIVAVHIFTQLLRNVFGRAVPAFLVLFVMPEYIASDMIKYQESHPEIPEDMLDRVYYAEIGNKLSGIVDKVSYFSLLLIVLILLGGWMISSMLMERREK